MDIPKTNSRLRIADLRFFGPLLIGTLSLTLAACGPSDNDPGPGAVTVGEARALDEAAEMLDEQRTPAEVLGAEALSDDGVEGVVSSDTASSDQAQPDPTPSDTEE